MSRDLTNRTLLFNKNLINNNMEFDYLKNIQIDYNTFTGIELNYRVKTHNLNRIDTISQDVYGTPYFWWLIMDRNNIFNENEFYVGQELKIPNLNDYYDFFNKKVIAEELNNISFDRREL